MASIVTQATETRTCGGHQAAYKELAKVAKSETENLVENGISRDLVALHAGAETRIRLPPSVDMP